MTLELLAVELAIARLEPTEKIPKWFTFSAQPIASATKTLEELSIVCPAALVPAKQRAERGWRALRIAGTIGFEETGIISALSADLAHAGISIFVLSTFDTDYILIREADVRRAIDALSAHRVIES